MFLQPIAQKVDPWGFRKDSFATQYLGTTAQHIDVRCNKPSMQMSVSLHHLQNGPHLLLGM